VQFYTSELVNNYFDNQVLVWQVKILNHQEPSIAFLSNFLTDHEIERYSYFKMPADKIRFAALRIALRDSLSKLLKTHSSKIRIAFNAFNKPYLADHTQYKFNISHSGNRGLIAISHGHEVGVDIEQLRSIDTNPNLTDFVFSPEEKKVFQQLEVDKKQEFFFTCWVKKESILKAIGTGFSQYNPKDLSISSRLNMLIEEKNIQICELPLKSDYVGALAILT
jgi:4'-phosphopantetheinyl transferase